MIFTESRAFARKVFEILSEDSLIDLENLLIENPDSGEVIPRAKGLRKITQKRVVLDPETYRQKQARAWKAKTEAARIRHELNLTQENFAALLGISLATVRKWESGSGSPSGAAKTLLAIARKYPEVVREAAAR